VPEAVLTSTVDHVRVITLNRPEARNAIDSDLSLGVFHALADLDADENARVGILTGAGSDFCAGMDLKAFAQAGLPDKIDAILRNGCKKPLVAAIEGVAVGGGLELALIADLLVGSSTARLGSPEVKFGLFPGGGALLRLPRYLPLSLVVELALTGKLISAETAFEHGLLVRLTEPGAALDSARELAAAIVAAAPLGVAAVKQLLGLVPGRTESDLWEEQVSLVDAVFTSEDAAEGARAFAEKRSPRWTGR
jgi:enoyl-CoA hydratase